MDNKKIARELLKIADYLQDISKEERFNYRQKHLPELDNYTKFVSQMMEAQKVYGDEYSGDDRFTAGQQRELSQMRNLNWKGKYKSSRAFLVEVRKAIFEYGDFKTSDLIKVVKKFGNYKYCLARESSVCIYIKGIKDISEVAILTKEFLKIRANEVSLNKGNSILWAEWANKLHGLDEYSDENLKNYELRVWWD